MIETSKIGTKMTGGVTPMIEIYKSLSQNIVPFGSFWTTLMI